VSLAAAGAVSPCDQKGAIGCNAVHSAIVARRPDDGRNPCSMTVSVVITAGIGRPGHVAAGRMDAPAEFGAVSDQPAINNADGYAAALCPRLIGRHGVDM